MLPKHAKIYVAGHRGLVGSAIVRALRRRGFTRVVTATRQALDLRDPAQVEGFFAAEQPEFVFLAAAKVGGIVANRSFPAAFIRDNLLIQTNVIDCAQRHAARKLLFLGSSCIYPREAQVPIRESQLLTGPLEETNAPYAIAKIAGIATVEAYRREHGFDAISLMPTNLYGPGDSFHPENSHVIPGLMQRFHWARVAHAASVSVWGSGSPLREFLHVDDLAAACLLAMERYSEAAPLNVGSSEEVSIRTLAQLLRGVVGFRGRLEWDTSRPDGTLRKLIDSSRLRDLGWSPTRPLAEGLAETYAWYRTQAIARVAS